MDRNWKINNEFIFYRFLVKFTSSTSSVKIEIGVDIVGDGDDEISITTRDGMNSETNNFSKYNYGYELENILKYIKRTIN